MTAIWILLGIAVLFGGAILAFVVHAIRHDDSAARTPADTEVGRDAEATQ